MHADRRAASISMFAIGPANGFLMPLAPPAPPTGAGTAPTRNHRGSPSTHADRGLASISMFASSAANGSLMPLRPPTVGAGTAPTRIATAP